MTADPTDGPVRAHAGRIHRTNLRDGTRVYAGCEPSGEDYRELIEIHVGPEYVHAPGVLVLPADRAKELGKALAGASTQASRSAPVHRPSHYGY